MASETSSLPISGKSAGLSLGFAVGLGFLAGWWCHSPGTVSPAEGKWGITQPGPRPPEKNAAQTRSAAGGVAGAFDAALAVPALYRQRLLLGQAVADLDRAGVVAALDQEIARGSARRPTVLMVLFSRLAELDAPAAAVRAAGLFDPDQPEESFASVRAALGPWLAQDRTGAEKWWSGLPPGPLRGLVTAALLEQLTDADPKEALRLVLQSGHVNPRTTPLDKLFTRLAELDPRAASQAAQDLPNEQAARGALERVAATWAARDPAGAYAWFQAAPNLSKLVRVRTLMSVYQAWSKADPAAAGAFLLAQGTGADTSEGAQLTTRAGVEVIGASWAQRDPSAALAWMGQLPTEYRDGALKGIMATWGKNDPRGVAMYAASATDSGAVNRYLEPALTTWAQADPAAVRDWVQTLPAGDVRKSSASRLAREWSNQDPQAALNFLVSEKNDLSTYLLSKWMDTDPDKAVGWSQGLPPSPERDHALSTIVSSLGRSDPSRAQTLYTQISAGGQPAAAQYLMDAWGARDPQGASAWLAGLPEGAARDEATASLAKSWGFQNVQGACDWLTAQPASPVRDTAVSQMVSYVGDGHHEVAAAIPLAEGIQDPGTRTNALETIARAWLKKDAAAANAWILQTPDFSAKQRAKLTAPGG